MQLFCSCESILMPKYVCMCEFYLQFMDADGKGYLDMRYSFVNRKDSGGEPN